MALAFESLSKEAKEEERSKRAGWLGRLPKTTPEQELMQGMAVAWAQMREACEDQLEALVAAADGKADTSPEVARLNKGRKAAKTAATWMKRAGVAAQEGAAGALEIFTPHQLEEDMTDEEAKAYKAYKKKAEDAKKQQQQGLGFPGGAGARRRERGYSPYPSSYSSWNWYQPYAQGSQWAASETTGTVPAAASSAAAATSSAAQGQLALGYGGQNTAGGGAAGSYFGGASQRQRFPCKACGKFGHWMRDGLCKPDDVAAEMARKYSLMAHGRSATGIEFNNS
jgi:hypothetical protein